MPPLYKSRPHPCPYLEGREAVNLMFFSDAVDGETWAGLLETGWRRFGTLFFRPDCPGCTECRPIRIPVDKFQPTRSQKKAETRNRESRYQIINIRQFLSRPPGPEELSLVQTAWSIYRRHGETRFGTAKDDLATFAETFFTPAVESLFCLSAEGDSLVGVGFLDLSPRGTSSVYFCFDPARSRKSPGTWSVLKEIEYTARAGLPYYYLGYWIPGCSAMAYKARFRPHELYDWEKQTWTPA